MNKFGTIVKWTISVGKCCLQSKFQLFIEHAKRPSTDVSRVITGAILVQERPSQKL